MGIPVIQQLRVGAYILKQKILGRSKYPLVLMLEPLFRCNLACAGCGKIDYPKEILNQRLSTQECIDSVEECGAPIVSIPGGEPLIHREMPEIVKELISVSPLAQRTIKSVLNATQNATLHTSIDLEGEAYGRLRSSNDFKEGVESFSEKRPPSYKGN